MAEYDERPQHVDAERRSARSRTHEIVAWTRLLAVGINPEPWLGIVYACPTLYETFDDFLAKLPWLCWRVAVGTALIEERQL
jgi:hypothetical protein